MLSGILLVTGTPKAAGPLVALMVSIAGPDAGAMDGFNNPVSYFSTLQECYQRQQDFNSRIGMLVTGNMQVVTQCVQLDSPMHR